MPEGRHVFATLTVEENLLVGAHTRGSRRDVETDLARWFEAFPVLAELRRRPAAPCRAASNRCSPSRVP